MPAVKKNNTQPPATVQNFPIVGIGASAGGLDAFKRLLKAIPENSGMAYVLVQHLDPTHDSILPEILQRVTKIPVHEITEDIHIAPDHIYIIPSNKILTSTDGVLKLSPREKKILNFSIDIFFTSIAEIHKEFAVGVVLSGTGSDGTLGLKAIKEHGGISIAQDSASAAYESMPQSAINADVVDFILAPEEIPEQLLLINRTYKTNHFYKAEEELPKDDDSIFKQILLLLRQRNGVDFTYYKQPTFHRRIARRIAIVKKNNLADYLKLLRTDKAEQDALFQDVLIPVTSFFRDPKTYKALTDTVFPALFKNKPADEPIRVWIAACSTGEEAYSIAISLHEFLGDKLSNSKIQIFATDISEKAIKKARAAIYTKADVEKLSATQLKNYFVKNNGGYEVSKFIRDICVFAPHNFLKDPPFAKMDLITCRNALIYMDTFLQKKAFSTFHYALKENGFLLLGKSETPGTSSDLFTQIDKHEKIYSRKPLPGRFLHIANERFTYPQRGDLKAQSFKADLTPPLGAGGLDFKKSAEAIMIAKSPASVVVNEAMDIVYIHGDITPFLQAPQGKPTYNLLKMAREGLAFELRNAIHKAKKEQTTVTKENIPVKATDKQFLVTIEIIPLNDTIELHNLIRFEKIIIPFVKEEKKSTSSKIIETQKQNEQLEKELGQTREDMRSITEDMEATNEELQSANEELQSSNEEMQSLNEELETSKEELQSTNEELLIVNQELLDKQEQLNALYSEQMKASKLIEASEKRFSNLILQAPVLINTIIGPSFIVETINKTALDIWGKSYEEVINKPLFDSSPEMEGSIKKILNNVYTTGESFIANEIVIILKRTGKPDTAYFNTVYQPLRDINNKIYGIIVVGTEVTEAVNARKLIEANTLLINSIYMNAPASICTFKGPQHVYELVNPAYQKLFDKRDLVGKPLLEALPELKGQGVDKILDNVYNTGEVFTSTQIPVMIARAENVAPEQRYFNTTMQPIYNEEHKIIGVVNFGYDVTEQIVARKQVEESETKFRTLSETIPNMIWTATADGKKNFFNKYFLEYTGLSFDEMKDDGMQKIIFPADLKKDLQLWKHSLKTGEDFNMEKRIRHYDGTYQWHLTHAIAQKDILGNIIGWVGSSTEIEQQKIFTEELEVKVKERTAELQILNEELNQTNSQLEQFAYVASHDLQEPLRKIVTFAMRLQDMHKAEMSEEVITYLFKIEGASKRMRTLIEDLLNFSRLLQHEKIFEPTDLNDIIKNILSDFELLIQENKAKITFDKLPTIDAIPLQMNQLFYNLISNALKFSKKNVPPVITIKSRLLSKKEIQKNSVFSPLISYVEIIFKDNGIGFEQQYAEKIFIIFQRLHSKDNYTGTGIGLALTKKIIENHHGEIFANAKENKGAAFHVILPIKQSE